MFTNKLVDWSISNCVCAVQSKEEAMMARIKDAENAQTVAEMTQRIADLEIQVRS